MNDGSGRVYWEFPLRSEEDRAHLELSNLLLPNRGALGWMRLRESIDHALDRQRIACSLRAMGACRRMDRGAREAPKWQGSLPRIREVPGENRHAELQTLRSMWGAPQHRERTWQGLDCVLCEGEGVCHEFLQERSVFGSLRDESRKRAGAPAANEAKRRRAARDEYHRELARCEAQEGDQDNLLRTVQDADESMGSPENSGDDQ